ncbi:hypothetical protein H5S09_09280 [Limosilactobacillus sp. STM2_1]|uniref:HTH hxlR-type domain-containing protein n=1 Tax=Limosilactobacillus rudii TaxID=2759755 RepID=A0A7W3UM56_9LACO|nr:hypothetical protein [Limosilactobacillus rudii]MBB1079995.1 hypothetical protein [Limosilactobacillus rudii]MBB1098128.1 hypothetical protein [Limosilactobacillus rudii]MCD7135198.1 hypothetical protein [Limosilactobacillus rudii]
MLNNNYRQGIEYPLSILREKEFPQILFWLGIKPLNFEDLQELVTGVSINRLISVIEELQDHYLISPIKKAECFTLTNGGAELARLVTSLGVWGRQQMDENTGNDSQRVILPDSSMNQSDLLKYRKEMSQYI